jgi:hypothetical protein
MGWSGCERNRRGNKSQEYSFPGRKDAATRDRGSRRSAVKAAVDDRGSKCACNTLDKMPGSTELGRPGQRQDLGSFQPRNR